ncbi:MAG: type I restriction enzyme HsdR N-terminal domain-containing protein [Bacteroides sp.]
MNQLHLPAAELKIIQKENKPYVFDILRKKYILITPEEWVRQHFVHFLIQHKEFPKSLMANEVLLHLNGMQRRCDTVVYQRDLKPKLIIEYKAPHIKIDQKVFNQISRYNFVLQVDYLIVSNGLQHYYCKMDYANKSYTFMPEIPLYADL